MAMASQFVSELRKADTSVQVYEVTRDAIEGIEKLIPDKMKAVHGTMRLHQVITEGHNPNCHSLPSPSGCKKETVSTDKAVIPNQGAQLYGM
ncbi:hypothetical protein ElyMa_005041900 [Elysia marginata]|uniref:Uncharacterized protein n=1 Tax=Elysia marginata TaxID=1093978 RepID=A0AAV4JFP7_9GAST|nr:hypothetical protein ElyMa_005041900 [Elysia marginata]